MCNESTNCLNLRNFRSFDSKHIGPETPSKGNQVDLFTLGLQSKCIYIYMKIDFFSSALHFEGFIGLLCFKYAGQKLFCYEFEGLNTHAIDYHLSLLNLEYRW